MAQVYEIALSVKDKTDLKNKHKRSKEGDIIAIRRPGVGIGKKERAPYLWLRIQVPDSFEAYELIQLLDDGAIKAKRRYQIQLKDLPPKVVRKRVRDENDEYQPLLPISEDGYFIENDADPPLDIGGLVFDKLAKEYL